LSRAVLDTGVIVEYIDRRGLYHEAASRIFGTALSGKLELVLPHPVLSETYYVSARIYEEAGLGSPAQRARRLLGWLYGLPQVRVVGVDAELAVEAGEAKRRYRLALTDCYVLAAARVYGGRPVFRRVEAEMRGVVGELRRGYGVVFLEDYV